MSRRRTLSGNDGGSDGGGPGRLLLVACVGVCVVVSLWLGAVIVLGYGTGGRQTDTPDAPAPRSPNPSDGPGGVSEEVSKEVPEEPAAEGDPIGRGGGDGGMADGVPRAGGSEAPEVDDPPEGEGPDPDLPEGGSSAEPEGYDPLGTGAAPGDLSPTEKGRAEQAVANYVLYAFGYTGEDQSEYTSAVNLSVLSPEFYSTPGGESVAFFSERVASGGTRSTASLEGFEISRESLEEVTGTATFTMEGSVQSGRFSQELTLVKWGAGWKVRSAGALMEP